jgi:hypothetical protein
MEPNSFADYANAPDQFVATDCQTRMHVFKGNEDYWNGPIEQTAGMGQALIGALCSRFKNR